MEKGDQAPPPYPVNTPAPGHGGYAAPPPQAAYPPPTQYSTNVVTPAVTMVHVTGAVSFRDAPVHIRCPHCQTDTVTQMSYSIGLFCWMIVGIIVLFGGIFCCCLIPFCLDACKDVEHHCGNCNRMVGKYNRM